MDFHSEKINYNLKEVKKWRGVDTRPACVVHHWEPFWIFIYTVKYSHLCCKFRGAFFNSGALDHRPASEIYLREFWDSFGEAVGSLAPLVAVG